MTAFPMPLLDAEAFLRRGCFENLDHRDALLTLRGLLAHGLLEHCLRLRHRVDYGAAPELGRKRVALPFRASDMPSERYEYSSLLARAAALSKMRFAQVRVRSG